MNQPVPHRKRVKHFDLPGHGHELTFSCYRRMPLLTDDDRRRMLSESIGRALTNHGYSLLGFVYMPEHVHLIVYPHWDDARIDQLLYAIKRPFSFRVKQRLIETSDALLEQLTVRERPGKEAFRFWQEGPGYDRNLATDAAVEATIEYAHANPVRRGLCESPGDWKWSSWRHYHGDEQPDSDLPATGMISS